MADNRKTFRLDDDVAELLRARTEKTFGAAQGKENEMINRLLRLIPKQETEIERLKNESKRLTESLNTTDRQLQEASRELGSIKAMLKSVGSLLFGDR